LSPDEFKKMYFSSSISSNLKKTLTANIDDFVQTNAITNVTQFDWRSKDVLTSIKNQERCGSCWAFSVVESIESRLAIQYNQPPLDLSEQQLISCSSTSYDLYGCSGGVLPNAFSFLKNEDVTLVTAALYPFVSGDGKTEACKMNFLHSKGVRLLNYSYYSQIKENIMMDNIIKYGPTSNSVDAAMWQDYLSMIT
jgi:cathepsin O